MTECQNKSVLGMLGAKTGFLVIRISQKMPQGLLI
jgi:hypothetical protein